MSKNSQAPEFKAGQIVKLDCSDTDVFYDGCSDGTERAEVEACLDVVSGTATCIVIVKVLAVIRRTATVES